MRNNLENKFYMNDGKSCDIILPENEFLNELRENKQKENLEKLANEELRKIKEKQEEINNKIERLQVVPLFTNVMILPYGENPYVNAISKGGVLLANTGGSFDNPDTGQKDTLKQAFTCGKVIEVGPDCKYVKRGDDIFYATNGARPVPFMNQGFWMIGEQNIMVAINEDMKERFKHLE